MKNRYKILVFVLLLCTIFSTLLFVRPKVNAQVSDLTNTTWYFNSLLLNNGYFPESNFYSFFAETSIGGVNYAYIEFSTGLGDKIYSIDFGGSVLYNEGWVDESYRTITFIGGGSMSNSSLISFVENNATFVSGPPIGGDTENISGGYRFNSSISTSIFGDIEEQELDILFENNFFLYNNTDVAYDMFTLHTDDLGNNYFCFENSTSGNYIRAGIVSLDNSYISMFSQYRTLEWTTQEVSDDTYIWLNENGEFGEFDVPTESAPDDMFGWLLDSVNAFLQIEILPGVRIIWLIQFALVVPIALIILKLYFGG